MKVTREPLEGSRIERLVVTDPEASDHHPGEQVGYFCSECLQADETRSQIWHRENCLLAGQHGRKHYDDLSADVADGASPEFDASHPITVVRAAETDGPGGVHNGEVIAFRCECGNLDEDCFEVIHDEACPLAGRHGRRVVASGSRS